MRGDGTPESGRRDITSTPWPWMLPDDTPGTPAPGRKRRRFLAALLARLWPPSGNHRAAPGAPAASPAPAGWSWDRRCSPGAVTLTDMTAMRVPPYIQQQGGRHHG